MSIRIQKHIPLPTGRTSTQHQTTSEATEAMIALEEGDSFFLPATPDTPASIIQKRMTVRSVKARKAGTIDFFVMTKQVIEDYEDDEGIIHSNTKGVRIWRRPTPEDTI